MRVFSTEKITEDITNWPEERRAAVKFAREEGPENDKRILAVYPKGTEFFGKQADQLIALEKARIVDDAPRIENAEVPQ